MFSRPTRLSRRGNIKEGGKKSSHCKTPHTCLPVECVATQHVG